MKIYEIEAGEKAPISAQNEKFINMISTECSDALAAMQQSKKFLYRGIDYEVPAAFHGRPRNNRDALHSSRYIQNDFNAVMTTYGFATNRANCIFCTGNKSITNAYGYPYIIFPKNGFSLLWSPKVLDLFAAESVTDSVQNAANSENKLGAADAFVKHYGYTDNNLSQAIDSGKEIMISGEYYAFTAQPFRYTYQAVKHPNFEAIFSSAFNIPTHSSVNSGY
jgi:hypothetical protein